jgi:hypothetical protein
MDTESQNKARRYSDDTYLAFLKRYGRVYDPVANAATSIKDRLKELNRRDQRRRDR